MRKFKIEERNRKCIQNRVGKVFSYLFYFRINLWSFKIRKIS